MFHFYAANQHTELGHYHWWKDAIVLPPYCTKRG